MNYEVQPIDVDPANPLALSAAQLLQETIFPSRVDTQETYRPWASYVEEWDKYGNLCSGIVGNEDGVIAAATLAPPTKPYRQANIHLLAVRPDLQRNGLGTIMLAGLERQAIALGAGLMGVFAPGDAHTFYRKHQYKPQDNLGLLKKVLFGQNE